MERLMYTEAVLDAVGQTSDRSQELIGFTLGGFFWLLIFPLAFAVGLVLVLYVAEMFDRDTE